MSIQQLHQEIQQRLELAHSIEEQRQNALEHKDLDRLRFIDASETSRLLAVVKKKLYVCAHSRTVRHDKRTAVLIDELHQGVDRLRQLTIHAQFARTLEEYQQTYQQQRDILEHLTRTIQYHLHRPIRPTQQPPISRLLSIITIVLASITAAQAQTVTITAEPRLNVRSKPSVEASLLNALPEGTQIQIQETINTENRKWYRIIDPRTGKQGYIAAEYTDRIYNDKSSFERALAIALNFEGGYANHPDDPGGKTNHGVTQQTYNTYRTKKNKPTQDVAAITRGEVVDIYRTMYWQPAGCDKLPERIAILHFDTAVNMGVGIAARMLQKSVSAKVDGIVGPKTAKKVKKANYDKLITEYLQLRKERYIQLIQHNPKLESFYKGWMNRLEHLESLLSSRSRSDTTQAKKAA